ncbi:MAG: transporter [Rubricoccaceae bacterium]
MSRLSWGLLAALLALTSAPSFAQPWTSARPDGHAPIGVMGDHTHGGQEAMFSYRLMQMEMAGSRIGTEAVEDDNIVAPGGQNFVVTPTEMPMTMHMIGAMVAPVDRVTVMAMLPIVQMNMNHQTRAGGEFSTESGGLGDVKLTALVKLAEFGRSRAHVGVGASLPTGSIDETDVTPASAPNESQLPYPMQIGSGTFDVLPSVTYLGQSDAFGWGLQGRGVIRLGENSRGYTLGNRGEATGWASVLVSDALSGSVRVTGSAWDNISGQDPTYGGAVAMRMVPTVFTNLRAGERLDIGVGVNAVLPLDGLRVAAEATVPVYQRLSGPQLETDLVLAVGAQYALDF